MLAFFVTSLIHGDFGPRSEAGMCKTGLWLKTCPARNITPEDKTFVFPSVFLYPESTEKIRVLGSHFQEGFFRTW